MKKRIAAICVVFAMAAFSWGKGQEELFNIKKSQEEIDIMKGILNTTLSYVVQNARKQTQTTAAYPFNLARWQFSNINAYYLAGQGAVFMISMSSLQSLSQNSDFSSQELFRQIEESSKQMDAAKEAFKNGIVAFNSAQASQWALSQAGASAHPAPPAPSAAPAPPAPPAAPAPSASPNPQIYAQGRDEEARQKLAQYQALLRKIRDDEQETFKKFLLNLDEIRNNLIETIANYGDSLSTVKPDEYINLVFVTDVGFMKTSYDVVSVRKSSIVDYKAGKMDLDAFKKKVVSYTE